MKRFQIYILTILLFSVGFVNAQVLQTQEKRKIAEANIAFQNSDYLLAIDHFKSSLKIKETKEAIQGLSHSQYQIKNFEAAVEGYSYLRSNYELSTEDIIPFFESLVRLGDFEQAKTLYQFAKFTNRITLENQELTKMQMVIEKNLNQVNSGIVDELSTFTNLNSKYRDFGLRIHDGYHYFVSNRPNKFFAGTGNPYESLSFKAYRQASGQNDGIVEQVPFIKDKIQHGSVTFSDQFVFYAASQVEEASGIKKLLSKDEDASFPEIFFREKLRNGSYGPEKKLFNKSKREFAMIDPFWDEERGLLIFSSDMPGGSGGLDLYSVKYLGDLKWSDPVNLGSKINSKQDERSPFVKAGILYFSSNGQGGYGGYDIFSTKITDNQYSNPENLSPPINSHGDDLFYGLYEKEDEEIAVLSSNRSGDDDLYYLQNASNQQDIIQVRLFDMAYNTPIRDEKVNISNTIESKEILTNSNGELQLSLQNDLKDSIEAKYLLVAGFEVLKIDLPDSLDINTKLNLGLNKIKADSKLLFNSGFTSKDQLSLEVIEEVLHVLFLTLNHNPKLKIKILAHTDSRGTPAANKRKSDKRATAVKAYLREKGIEASRITAIGLGSTKLLNDCIPGLPCSDSEHIENDRIEIEYVLEN
ncbi:OmpA family protein [Belliella kenyensis]|uniref:OmpA family protein n=1 Tax=Belliella kenyensis TaxID=1472724 RepID=A0ABV8EFL9_9BACT|nr:OmpA family protein [Belliella kenyensis]MCH7401169.1 OmpA family protein [Belliella kenyensis]MDN3604166.1 OmpA family protein [Belliella kenyensis]